MIGRHFWSIMDLEQHGGWHMMCLMSRRNVSSIYMRVHCWWMGAYKRKAATQLWHFMTYHFQWMDLEPQKHHNQPCSSLEVLLLGKCFLYIFSSPQLPNQKSVSAFVCRLLRSWKMWGDSVDVMRSRLSHVLFDWMKKGGRVQEIFINWYYSFLSWYQRCPREKGPHKTWYWTRTNQWQVDGLVESPGILFLPRCP